TSRASRTVLWPKPSTRSPNGGNMGLESWAGSIDLNTPAGGLLRKLVSLLPADRSVTITVFDSALLQLAVDLFRPSFDEEQGQDMANNCRRLWPLIFGREID